MQEVKARFLICPCLHGTSRKQKSTPVEAWKLAPKEVRLHPSTNSRFTKKGAVSRNGEGLRWEGVWTSGVFYQYRWEVRVITHKALEVQIPDLPLLAV